MYIYDIECFKHDWVVIFHDLETEQKAIFHNDGYELFNFISAHRHPPVIGGYNTKHYDQWILKAIYHGADNSTVKELNDFIIGGENGWNHPFLSYKKAPWINFDLMDDIPVFLRLKEIEGNLGLDIEECDVPFDIDRPLTDPELEKVIRYCSHDVDAAVALFGERADYLSSKIAVGAMAGLSEGESLRLTNAKLTAAYLGATLRSWDDELVYDVPDNLVIEKYTGIMAFFARGDPTFKSKLKTEAAGTPHTFGWGGVHGAIPCYQERSTSKRTILHVDVTSYYPSLMIQNGYLSRNAPDPEEFKRVYERRIAAKKSGDKGTGNALKLVLNTTFGASNEKHNALYDPRMAHAVCISGQLYLVDLIEKLEDVPTFRLIQSNTDGLIVSCDNTHIPGLKEAISGWELRTGFSMELDEIECIFQKDVNNYVMRDTKGEIAVKGVYVSNYTGGDFKNKSLVIVAKAIAACLLDGVPAEDTINACEEMWQFQIVCKAGGTYDKVVHASPSGKDIDVQNVNRVYASINKDSGTLYRVKLEKNRRDKIANLPDHCFIDNRNHYGISMIDRRFYIDMAQKRINNYLGIKPEKQKKERKKRMPAAKKTEAPQGIAVKLMTLREAMNAFSWEKDGLNRRQGYEYITEKQYKNNFKAALSAAELDFTSSMLEYQFIPAISDKMNMVLAKFEFQLVDRSTGESETYVGCGSGADMGDKGMYKAYTGALKYFIANNFLVAEGTEPEAEDEPAHPVYTPPERREEVKQTLTNQDDGATDEQLEAIAMGITMLQDANVDQDMVDAFIELLETPLTKGGANEILDAIRGLLPEDAA